MKTIPGNHTWLITIPNQTTSIDVYTNVTEKVITCTNSLQKPRTGWPTHGRNKSTINRYITDLNMCTRDDSEEFDTWLLCIDKASKLIGHDTKEIHFAKTECNLLKFLYSIPLQNSHGTPLRKECMQNF